MSTLETPELRAVVLDIPSCVEVEVEESQDVVSLNVSKCFLETRASAVDTVRQYYQQAMQSGPSLRNNKSNPTSVASPHSHRVSINSDNKDITFHEVVFPILTGPIGSGKSHLIEYALKTQVCEEQGGYYIYTKFDLMQHADPHRAFIVAWTAFAKEVVRRGPVAIITIRDTILSACQNETSALLEMIPALSSILDFHDDASPTDGNRRSSKTEHRQSVSLTPLNASGSASLQRFLFVFQSFVEAIAKLEHPLVLVFNDLQWADPSAMDFICSILQDVSHIPGFFVIGTHDNCMLETLMQKDGIGQENYLVRKLQEAVQASNHMVTVQMIPILDLNFDQVKHVLNQTLQQSSLFNLQIEDDICQLVYQNTLGNLSLVLEFLKWLREMGLLKKERPRNASTSFTYWTWNIGAIQRAIIDRKKDKITGRQFYIADLMSATPTKMIELLKVCACFGSLHTEDTLLEYVLEYPVHSLLEDAVKLGILNSLGSGSTFLGGKMYGFQHDILQMAAYDIIPEYSRELFHLEIGRRLWRRLSQVELDHYLFVLLSQLIVGRHLISRPNERYSIATLCLHTGRKAANLSNFGVALIYMNFGIELLGDLGWKHMYDVSLATHNDACEMEMCAANFEGMEVLVESIVRNARCDRDKLQARMSQLYVLSVSDRQEEGLDLGIKLLSNVGSPLPKTLSLLALLRKIRSVQNMLKGKSNEYLKRLPIVEDEDILAAMRILHLIFLPAILQRPKMAPFVGLMMMNLTLKHGLSFMSPLAFAAYGMLCIGMSDTNSAFRYGDLGLELLDQLQVREYIPRVYAVYYSCVFAWKYPLWEALGPMLHAHRVGMQTGDIEFSCLCANLWCFMSIDSGCVPLNEIEKQWRVLQITMKSHRQTSLIRLSVPWLQTIAHYQGQDVDFTETETILKESVDGERNLYANDIYWCQAKTAYLFNDLDRADELAYIANFWKVRNSSAPTAEVVYIAFLNGMIAFAMLIDQQGNASVPIPCRSRRQYLREGQKMIRFIKKYALWCPTNFLGMKILLQAELASVKRQLEKAKGLYICAIAFAKDNRSLFVQALANERSGKFCFKTLQRPREAVSYFSQALSVYTEWGAHRKVDHLSSELKDIFGKDKFTSWFTSGKVQGIY